MYGHEIYNERGNLLFNQYEESLMYVGKMFVQGEYTDVMGIPKSENACLFFKGDDPMSFMETGFSGDVNLRVRIRKGGTSSTDQPSSGWVYVFLKPTSIPIDSYGLAVYGQDGLLTYHSTTPPLQVSYVFNNVSAVGEERNSSGNVAILTQLFGNSRVEVNQGGVDKVYKFSYIRNYCYSNGANSKVGIEQMAENFAVGGSANTWISFTAGEIVNLVGIDTDFYDQFDNLGTYPFN